eukprot:m.174848 g.174848  ORF g.174848 m.174848 type:complete len:736 (+) comp17336_c0_seq1:277-2484(+)
MERGSPSRARSNSGGSPTRARSNSSGSNFGRQNSEVPRLLALLADPSASVRVQAARQIKNAVIGSRARKSEFIDAGAVNRLVNALGDVDGDVRLQAASALGSFAHGSREHARAVSSEGVVRGLSLCLSDASPPVVEAAVRSLKIIFSHSQAKVAHMFGAEDTHHQQRPILKVVTLLSEKEAVAESAASLLSSCYKHAPSIMAQQKYCENAIVHAVLSLLEASPPSKITLAVLDLLVQLTSTSESVCYTLLELWNRPLNAMDTSPPPAHSESSVTSAGATASSGMQTAAASVSAGPPTLHKIFQSFLSSSFPTARIAIAACLANMSKASGQRVLKHKDEILFQALMVLVKMLKEAQEPVHQSEALFVLAGLLQSNDTLQRRLYDLKVIRQITSMLSSDTESDDASKTTLAALTAIAALCDSREENRREVIESDGAKHIVAQLKSPRVSYRLAAAQCVHSLSRSVKNLRTALLDAGVVSPVLDLVGDPDMDVRVAASAALCNLVLEFTPMKQAVTSSGGIAKLVELVHHENASLRLNGVWALKNLVFETRSTDAARIKSAILESLPLPILVTLMDDSDVAVQEQATALLRNLVYGGAEAVTNVYACLDADTTASLLANKIAAWKMHPHGTELVSQALYVVCNLAAGTEIHKDALLHSRLMPCIVAGLESARTSWIVPSLLCVSNLVWKDDSGSHARLHELQQSGVVTRVGELVLHPDIDVRNRAKAVEHQFRALLNM